MVRVEVSHYLTQAGLDYFPTWFDQLVNTMKSIDGFIDITYFINSEESKACITLFFENNEKLNLWAKSLTHYNIITELDIYRTKPWDASRHQI